MRQDIPSLTGVRFLAASYVMLFHMWPLFMRSLPGGRYWNQLVSLGYLGVSFFFVLSGFILARVYLGEETALAAGRVSFWETRFARLYPAYLLSMLVSAPFIVANAGRHGRVFQTVKAVVLVVSNGCLLQAWHPVLSGNWNRPTWSVSAEAFFYLLFPLIGPRICRYKGELLGVIARLWLVSVSTSALCVALLGSNGVPLARLEVFLFNPVLRLPEFGVGICCGLLSLQLRRVYGLNKLALLSVLWVLLLVPTLVRLPWLVVSNGLLAPFFGLLIVNLSTSRGWITRILGSAPFVELGRASYSLYLFQFPILFWLSAARGTARFGGYLSLDSNRPGLMIAYYLLTVASSVVIYHLVEAPARRAIKVFFSRSRGNMKPPASRILRTEEGIVSQRP